MGSILGGEWAVNVFSVTWGMQGTPQFMENSNVWEGGCLKQKSLHDKSLPVPQLDIPKH